MQSAIYRSELLPPLCRRGAPRQPVIHLWNRTRPVTVSFRRHSQVDDIRALLDLEFAEKDFEPPPIPRPTLFCYGCGLELQTEDPKQIGFIKEEKIDVKLKHKQWKQLMCNRCVELSRGKMIPGVQDLSTMNKKTPFTNLVSPGELRQKLKSVREKRVVVVLLVDLLDVPGSFLNSLRPLIGRNPIFLLGTKLDLLPRMTYVNRVKEWLREIAVEKKLNVVDVHLISNRSNQGISQATSEILKMRNGRDIYVMGLANVGKTAFVKTFLTELQTIGSSNFTPDSLSKKKFLPVESSMPGTTLGIIELKALERKGSVYDTPGVHIFHRLVHMLNPDELSLLHPRRALTPYIPPSPYDICKQLLQKKLARSLAGDLDEEKVMDLVRKEPEEISATYFWGGIVRIDIFEAPSSVGLIFMGPRILKVHPFPLLSPSPVNPQNIYPQFVQGLLSNQEINTRYLDAEALFENQPKKSPAGGMDLAREYFGRDSVLEHEGLFVAREFNFECYSFDEVITEVSISGLPGWITILVPESRQQQTQGRLKGCIWTPRGVEVFLRTPIPVPNPLNKQQ